MNTREFLRSKKIYVGANVADENAPENHFRLEDLLSEFAESEVKKFHKPDVSCSIRYSESEEMIQIINKDGKVVFGGNYWDFNRSPEGFKRLFESLGINVTMDDTYRYE